MDGVGLNKPYKPGWFFETGWVGTFHFKSQLLDYQTRLKSRYNHSWRLQLISVVAVGFERVVWQRVS